MTRRLRAVLIAGAVAIPTVGIGIGVGAQAGNLNSECRKATNEVRQAVHAISPVNLNPTINQARNALCKTVHQLP
jgi:uncharacterized protein (DUF1499 family)